MHEYTFMKNVIDNVLAQVERDHISSPITQLNLTVGVLEVHSEAAAHQAFEVLRKGTPLEHTRLHLDLLPVTLHCHACHYEGSLHHYDHHHDHEHDHAHHHDHHPPDPLLLCPRCGAVCVAQGGTGVSEISLLIE